MGLFGPAGSVLGLLERAVVALEELARRPAGAAGALSYRAPGSPARAGKETAGVDYVDDEEMALREARKVFYELSTGKRLADDEDPPALPQEKELAGLLVGPEEG